MNADRPMYALTVQQPWAALIRSGFKRVENRTWFPPRSQLVSGDWLAIHAGLKLDHQAGFSCDGDQVRGAIVALARYLTAWTIDELRNQESLHQADGVADYAAGPICWLFPRVVPLDKPIACGGHHRLWKVQGVPAARLAKFMETGTASGHG